MTPELQQYYEDRLEMTGSQAWKDLIQDIDEMIKSTNRLDGVDTLEKLHFRKGELSIMNWLKNLPEISEAAYNQLKEDGNA